MDIDIVYTWVNHRDKEWRNLFEKALASEERDCHSHPSIHDIARFYNREELFYSIKSVLTYASWVRKIFIVTNCTLPHWAQIKNKIRKVSHEEIFQDRFFLPTFNSRAIEANLHRIKGLSEHFIYFNDDVFLCKKVTKTDFFSKNGKPYVFPSKHNVPYRKIKGLRPVDYGILNACELLVKDFGYVPQKKLHHAPFPLKKSILCEIEERYKKPLQNTTRHRFRDNSDLPLATTLHAYYSVANDYGELKEHKARYIDIGDPLFLLLVHPFSRLRRRKYTSFCLNEITNVIFFSSLRDRIVISLLKSMM